jgi:hypothetical protein
MIALLSFAAGFAACWFGKDYAVAAWAKAVALYNSVKAKF